MSASLFLILRILFAWAVAILLSGFVWGALFGDTGAIFWLLASTVHPPRARSDSRSRPLSTLLRSVTPATGGRG